jgi:hypothetical protein
MLRSLMTGAALVTTVLALTACESKPKEKPAATTQPNMGMLNSTCPMSGEPVDPAAKSVEYSGYNIGLCCNGCEGPWNKKSDAEKKAAVAKYTK